MTTLYACKDFKALPNSPQVYCQTWVELPQSGFDSLAITSEQAEQILVPLLGILSILIAFKLVTFIIKSI